LNPLFNKSVPFLPLSLEPKKSIQM